MTLKFNRVVEVGEVHVRKKIVKDTIMAVANCYCSVHHTTLLASQYIVGLLNVSEYNSYYYYYYYYY